MRSPAHGVEACQRCGSADLRLPSTSDGVIVGLGQNLGYRACERCGLVGVPFEFDSEAARVAYEGEKTAERLGGARP